MSKDTIRHLGGGFLGGVLGILACGYLSPAYIPFGCLLGVIVGYWHDVIWETIKSDHARPKLPHPMTNASFVAITMAILFATIPVGLMVGFYLTATTVLGYGALSSILIALWVIGVGGALIFTEVIFLRAWRDVDAHSMAWFYTEWSLWSRGKLQFAGFKMSDLLRTQIVLMAELLALFVWFVLAATYLILTALPISIFIGASKGIFIAARRGGYWICFATTLATTAAMAYAMSSHLKEPATLWLTALAAGTVSAAASEAIRQGILAFTAASPRYRRLIRVPLYRRNEPRFKFAFDTMFDFVQALTDRLNLDRFAPKFW